ncbi:MAG: acyltransferase domain-containing protein, partial [Proteobacteria bacterium]|nr:acyltransferase domain-containing protein [Pseudomonadota bacterium]
SVYDVFGSLCAGSTLVLPEPTQSYDPDAWLQLIEACSVTIWNSAPSLMELFVERLDDCGKPIPSSLRKVLLSGDWIGLALAHRLLREQSLDLVSLGGATEASIWSIAYCVDHLRKEWRSIPYGRSLRGQSVFVFDERLERCPVWAAGEIYIGGVGLARGYWRAPDQSARSFVNHPRTGERLFKTGDLGRYRRDGNIEILGREDLQVKISGHRIELAEIEFVLSQYPMVRDVVVTVLEPGEGQDKPRSLIAFVVRNSTNGVTGTDCLLTDDAVNWGHELRRYCETRLPLYMVPTTFVELDAVPLTANGKVDRESLGHRASRIVESAAERDVLADSPHTNKINSGPNRAQAMVQRRTIAQTVLHQIKEVAPNSGVADPQAVFSDYGFTSLMGLRLRNRLEKAFDLRLPATLIWRFPTPASLIDHIAKVLHEDTAPLSPPKESNSQRVSGESAPEQDLIAIIGMGCRFPHGSTPEHFFSSLLHHIDSVGDLAPRWESLGLTPPQQRAWAGLLDQVTDFDAEFFSITPREAVSLDPQQRLLLEVCWEALENAGLVPATLMGTQTGVFVGAMYNDYQHHLSKADVDRLDQYAATGTGLSFTAGRVSYFFGFQGPCLTVDTACSSSLVALHQACESLRTRQSEVALAGGVSLILHGTTMDIIGKTQALSPTGRCRTFDHRADGFVRGEGCGVLVLKRLADAQRDGDQIVACVRASAVNQDGRSTGLTAPNVESQITLHRQALARAELSPAQVTFIETHGTGTSLGDPIEVEALSEVYGSASGRTEPCWLGALKSHIGHLEGAAGVAGVIKAVLAIDHGCIPPNLHFEELNPALQWDESAFALPTKAQPWLGERRYAAVSAFGMSGTNAHVILQFPPADVRAAESAEHREFLLPLSARTPQALDEQILQLEQYVRAQSTADVQAIAHHLATGRTHFTNRLALHVDGADGGQALGDRLEALRSGQPSPGVHRTLSESKAIDEIAFLFTGQGAQYAGMGLVLYEKLPAFAQALDACAAILDPLLPQPLLSVMFAKTDKSLINQTGFAQPALFALEYALFQAWASFGVRPTMLLGHSVGEIVAACVAGMMSLKDALRLVEARGRLMQALPEGGAMASVGAAESIVATALKEYSDTVSIAAINAPELTVISGLAAHVTQLGARFEEQGFLVVPLAVSHAFHSPLMEPILSAFREVGESIDWNPPQIPIVSCSSATINDPESVTASYWVDHIRQPVRFSEGFKTMHRAGLRAVLELGPQPVLATLGRRSAPDPAMLRLPSMRRGGDDYKLLLSSLAKLYVNGCSVEWQGLYGNNRPPVLDAPLPNYPFQRRRYWLDSNLIVPVAPETREYAAVAESLVQVEWRPWEPTTLETDRLIRGRRATEADSKHRLPVL